VSIISALSGEGKVPVDKMVIRIQEFWGIKENLLSQ
jgi:hypothetical protein